MPVIDMTGRPPSADDVNEALAVVTKFMAPPKILDLPPELAVQLMNIRRCLVRLNQLELAELERKIAP